MANASMVVGNGVSRHSYLRSLANSLPFIGGVDLATKPDKTAVTKKLKKSVHNHPRTADGKKVVTLSERKKAKRKMARKSKQRNCKYAS